MKKEEIVKKIKELKKKEGEFLLNSKPDFTSGEESTLHRVCFSVNQEQFKVEEIHFNFDFDRRKPWTKFLSRNEKTYPTIEEGVAEYLIEGKPLESLVKDVIGLRIVYM